jgi:hypothetical protein
VSLRKLAVVTAVAAVTLASVGALARAGGSPPLPRNALFPAITPRNVEEVRNRLNGSTNGRNQIPVGAVLAYKTSAGNFGKLEIVGRRSWRRIPAYDLYVTLVTYGRDGSVLVPRNDFRIRGTWLYDLDTGKEVSTTKSRAADLWWEIVGGGQDYVVFENGATFTIVS